ncbi:hypothetical protein LUX33_00280 [Actinomadura madurae]|uniref:hypothetical protein n=1 Tax=Actinomadura madurae TaxID=1993 RepID=UPI0020D21170|nr:hypothetical protein [Actinomadura madurae]MCP9947049.1 hypothetical protein [Actinomadura madurae]
MWKPKYFHVMTAKRVGSAVSGSANHLPGEAAEQRQVLDDLVGQPVARQEDDAEQDAGDHLRQDVGREEDRPVDRPAAHPLVEQDGRAERDRQLDGHREHDDQQAAPQVAAEDGVVGELAVVAEPDEVLGPAEAPQRKKLV